MTDEEQYFQTIESHFLQKRGNPMLLAPKEWSLIHEWYDAQIPAEIVVRSIDRAFERKAQTEDREISSLLYCRRFVKNEFKKYLKSLEGKQQAEPANAKNVAEYLEQLADSLGKSAGQARETGNPGLSEFLHDREQFFAENIMGPFLRGDQKDLQRVEQLLTDLEKEIEQVLLTLISEEQMTRLKEDSMRELKPFEGKLELAVYQEMLRRALNKAVRKYYSIPRFSLFYM
jgi:hypothetical protein